MKWIIRLLLLFGGFFYFAIIEMKTTPNENVDWPYIVICVCCILLSSILYFKKKYQPGGMIALLIGYVVILILAFIPEFAELVEPLIGILFLTAGLITFSSVGDVDKPVTKNSGYSYGSNYTNTYTTFIKKCSSCGRQVPDSSQPGQYCPYCKSYWN